MNGRFTGISALLAASLLAAPAAAQVTGNWLVNGDVAGRTFTVECHFIPSGTALGGACTDVSLGGKPTPAHKVHPLIAGAANGAQLQWSYLSHFMFMQFNVAFTGTLSGSHMAGAINTAGHRGTFNANQE